MLPQPPFKPAYYTLVIIDLCKVLSSRLNIADFFSQSLRDCFSFTILYRLQFYLFLLYNFIMISVSLNVWCLLLSNLVAMQQALPGAFPAVVAGAVRALFEKIADLDMECRTRLILWFSHHLYVPTFCNFYFRIHSSFETTCSCSYSVLCISCFPPFSFTNSLHFKKKSCLSFH